MKKIELKKVYFIQIQIEILLVEIHFQDDVTMV
jgi:hypothetical protein